MSLIALEYLNLELHNNILTQENFEALKKVIIGSIDEDSWNGEFSLETIEYKFCSICGKDLI